jgi:hypothetical protein
VFTVSAICIPPAGSNSVRFFSPNFLAQAMPKKFILNKYMFLLIFFSQSGKVYLRPATAGKFLSGF